MPDFVEIALTGGGWIFIYQIYFMWLGAFGLPFSKQMICWSCGVVIHLLLCAATWLGTSSHHEKIVLGNINLLLAGYFFGILVVTWWKHIRPKLAEKLAGYKHRAKMAAMRLRLSPSPA